MAPTYALTIHRDHACRHSGACCAAGWSTPVERPTVDAVTAAIARKAFTIRSAEVAGRDDAPPRLSAERLFVGTTAAQYQGGGVRTAVHALRATLGVLQIECVRRRAGERRPLDERLLLEAIRATDLTLVHLAAPDVLTRRITRFEDVPVEVA